MKYNTKYKYIINNQTTERQIGQIPCCLSHFNIQSSSNIWLQLSLRAILPISIFSLHTQHSVLESSISNLYNLFIASSEAGSGPTTFYASFKDMV